MSAQRDQRASIIYILSKGKMTRVGRPRSPESHNFVIVCAKGDWSGFRTLNECKAQFPQLEARNVEDGYFWVEER